jgi:hypothetical protein
MRLLFLSFAILLAACVTPAGAKVDCSSADAIVRQFFEGAGLRDRAEQPWFRDCVHPDARSLKLWSQIEADAISAHNAGRRILGVKQTGDSVRVDLDGATAAVRIFITNDGRIGDVYAYQPAATQISFAEIFTRLRGLPGRVSVVITRDGNEVAALDSDKLLEVASSMKLGVLKALLDEVAAGHLTLERNAIIRPDLKALPSGTLHQLPDNSPVTLHTLASLMMRDSDNTATDILIDAIGKEKVRAVLGVPWLMTFHQWFMLKADPALYAEFRREPEERKASWLGALQPKIPLSYSDSIAGSTPESGWFLSTRRLCELIDSVASSDFAQLESTLVQYPEWRSVASKAGGDQTSRNDTLLLTRLDGRRYCLSVTWNTDEAIFTDERYIFLVTTLIEAIRREE